MFGSRGSVCDYYPFGMLLPNRNGSEEDYRYGFNGMESDDEVTGDKGTSYTTEFRQYNPRVGRWLSLDPMMNKFPWQSPYVAFDNNPIYYIDPNGAESKPIDQTREYKRSKRKFDKAYSKLEKSGSYGTEEELRSATFAKIRNKKWAWVSGSKHSSSDKSSMNSFYRIDELAYTSTSGFGREYSNKVNSTDTYENVPIDATFYWYAENKSGPSPIWIGVPIPDSYTQGLNVNLSTADLDLSGSGLVSINVNSADITVTKFNDNSTSPEVVNIADGNGNIVASSGGSGLSDGASIKGTVSTNTYTLNTIPNPDNRQLAGNVRPFYTVIVKGTADVIQTKVVTYQAEPKNTNPGGDNKNSKRAFMKEVRKEGSTIK